MASSSSSSSNPRGDAARKTPEVPLTSPSTNKDFPAPDPTNAQRRADDAGRAQKQAGMSPGTERIRDPNPDKMKRATTDNIDDTMISGKTDAGITSPGPGRSTGSEH